MMGTPKKELTLDGVMHELQVIGHNPTKDDGERLQDSLHLINAYLGAQPDREEAYRALKEKVKKDPALDVIYSQI